jgi:TonB family protein
MFARIGIGLIIVVLGAGLTDSATAQTSSATVVDEPSADGTRAPVPVEPLEILDTDYPLESLIANEEGKVRISVFVDTQGRVSLASVQTPGKFPRLEQRAVAIARTRWQFNPATENSRPTVAVVHVDVDWRLPLEPVYEYQMLAEDRPIPRADVNIEIPVPITSHEVREYDFRMPSTRILTGYGVVLVRYLILEDGTIGETKIISSSGIGFLDDQAVSLIKKRWKYRPARLNGRTIKFWEYARFNLSSPDTTPRFPTRICTSEPILGQTISMRLPQVSDAVPVSQQIHIDPQGVVDDAIIQTDKGWMRFSKPLVKALAQQYHLPTARQARRPDSCWMESGLNVRRMPPGPNQ